MCAPLRDRVNGEGYFTCEDEIDPGPGPIAFCVFSPLVELQHAGLESVNNDGEIL
jgi:hypothetical protein